MNAPRHDLGFCPRCLRRVRVYSPLLAGCLLVLLGCQPDVNRKTHDEQTGTARTLEVGQVARTLELRSAYLQATTDEERKAVSKKLIPHLQKRYSGLDCHAPQNEIRPHYMLFRLLMLEWSPVGYTIEDLKAVAGKPRIEAHDSVTYVFDSGELAWVYRFKGRPYIKTVEFRGGQ